MVHIMKKQRWITWIIAGAMAASLTACGGAKDATTENGGVVAENMVQKGTELGLIKKKDQDPGEKATIEVSVGGWTKAESPEIREEYKKMFETLNSTLAGAQYEPVALLETQVVSGTNYRFLCRVTATVPDAKPYYAVVEVYKNLKDEVSITNTVESKVEAPTEQLLGGYTESKSMVMTDEARKAFDKAAETLTGMTYQPMLLVGTQVVAGTNYLIFCKGTASTAGKDQVYAFLTVYADLQGNATISEIRELGAEEEAAESTEAFETDTEAEPHITTEATEPEQLDGGWAKADSPKITKEHKALFKKATEKLAGATYEPVALLETQVVAGTNYRFLCRITATVPDATPCYSIVTLYEDLKGEVTITDTTDSGIEAPTQQLPGGYSEAESMELTGEAKEAFSKATETLTGVSYEPVLLLGSQVVAGMNYRILCRATASTASADQGYAILTIYADLQGNATISEVVDLK